MEPCASESYGNPSSRHDLGLAAERLLRQARQQIVDRLDAEPAQLTWTSGGSEALALAILGAPQRRSGAPNVVISNVEHDAVQQTARMLTQRGYSVRTAAVNRGGWVSAETVAAAIDDDTQLVAVMHVNNETGIIQPVAEIAQAIKAKNDRALFVVDTVQSLGKLPLSLDALGADVIIGSAHKLHGPKGSGFLLRRRNLTLSPLWRGGNQEQGLRHGTENVAGAVGFAAALTSYRADNAQWSAWAEQLIKTIREIRPDAVSLGDPDRRVAHILAVAIPAMRSETLVNALSQVRVMTSSGSACHSRGNQQSPVLAAMNIDKRFGVVRFSFGMLNNQTQIDQACQRIADTLQRLR